MSPDPRSTCRDSARLTVLVLGGYGAFGGRLVRLLADVPTLTLIVAGRSRERADAFCAASPAPATLVPAAIDRTRDLGPALDRFGPDIVVDASGPFQAYGAAPYGVVDACLARGIHYIDFADGTDFVVGIGRFDAEARARGVAVLSGASTFPVLSTAAVEALSADLRSVEAIVCGLAPSPYANLGVNVVRAVTAYAGRPFPILRGGKPGIGYGLTEGIDATIAPPGAAPLGRRHFCLVDVPDLRLLPMRWPSLQSVWVGTGPTPGMLLRMLQGLAWLVRLRLLPSLAPFAPLFHRTINLLRVGEHRSGLFVALKGTDGEGRPVERSWHLLAEGEDGPRIASMAAEGLVRRILAGDPPVPGARPAAGELSLADYGRLFGGRRIATGFRDDAPSPTLPLYRRMLGTAWDHVPPEVRALHDRPGRLRASGRAVITRGRTPLSRLIARLIGFPPPGRDVPVTVDFETEPDRETWQRDFAGRRFRSVQTRGRGPNEGFLMERFGAATVALALVVKDGRLILVPRRAWVFGIPLPRALVPGGTGQEFAENGRFNFDVEISHPLTGLIVHYRGWLEQDVAPKAPGSTEAKTA